MSICAILFFIIQYKHLTDAGYNILAYDFRDHGNGGIEQPAGAAGVLKQKVV